MANPWDSAPIVAPAGKGGVLFSLPGQGPKPPGGFAPPGAAPVAPLPGGPDDLGYIAKKAAATAGPDAAIHAAAEKDVAGYKAGVDLNTSIQKFKAERDIKAAPAVLTPQQKSDQIFHNDAVLDQIHQAQEMARTGWGTGWGSLLEHFPMTDANQLQAKLDAIKSNVVLGNLQKMKQDSPNGSTGLGRVTNYEAGLLSNSLGSLNPSQGSKGLIDSLNQIERSYRRMSLATQGVDPDSVDFNDKTAPAVVPSAGQSRPIAPPPLPGAGGGPPMPPRPPGGLGGPVNTSTPVNGGPGNPGGGNNLSFAQGGTQTVTDPTLAGVNAHVSDLIRGGASVEDIGTYLKSVGVDPNSGFKPDQSIANAVAWRQKHPGYLGNFDVSLGNKVVPMSPLRSMLNAGAQSAPGTAAMDFANAATAGQLPKFTGSPALTSAALDAASAQHPTAATAGTLAGGAAGVAGIDAGLGLAGMKAAPGIFAARPVLADAIYGGAYGEGQNPDHPIQGTLEGAALGVAGGVGGRGVVHSIASTVAPTGGALAPAFEGGVRTPTIGQRFATAGPIGHAINTIEQASQSRPLLGAFARNARQGARDEFERGAFDSALSEIGDKLPDNVELGPQSHAYMQKAFNDAYDNARSGMSMVPDPKMTIDMGNFQRSLQSGVYSDGDVQSVNKLIRDLVGMRLARSGGTLAGDSYKAAMSDLGKAAGKMGAERPAAAGAVRDFMSIMDEAARRNSTPEAVAAMDAADQGYAKAVRIEQAAAARGGGTGRFTPTQFDRAVQQTSGGVRSRAYLRGDALMGDYANAGKSLVDNLGDSGTAIREAVQGGGGFGALKWLNPLHAIGQAALTAPYLPGIRQGVAAAMRPRQSALANAIADYARSHARIPSLATVPLALTYQGNGN